MAKRKGATAEEFLARLATNQEYQAKKAERDRLRSEREAALLAEEAPLRADLEATAGISVHSVWDLVNTRASYAAAVPVLMDHLRRPYSLPILTGIARALGTPAAKQAWNDLRELFESNNESETDGLKFALAVALAGAADDSVMPDVIRLALDKHHGMNRAPFIHALARSSRSDARSTLIQLKQDEELSWSVRQLLKLEGKARLRSRSKADSEE
jgi:hypothetical protein